VAKGLKAPRVSADKGKGLSRSLGTGQLGKAADLAFLAHKVWFFFGRAYGGRAIFSPPV